METKDGKLVIDIYNLLRELSGESLIELINHLSVMDDVIERVGQQIAYGCTDDGWSGGTFCSAADGLTPLMKWRRVLANEAGEVAKREIAYLERAVEHQKKEINMLREELRKRSSGEYFYHY